MNCCRNNSCRYRAIFAIHFCPAVYQTAFCRQQSSISQNGENCCNHFLVQFEGDEEKIAELLEKYPICNVDNGNTKCDYNNPSQYVGAFFGGVDEKGQPSSNGYPTLNITGHIHFGGIEIHYI